MNWTKFIFLLDMLEEDGHKITLQQADERNYVELVIHEEVIFRCKIQDLNFGTFDTVIMKFHFSHLKAAR